MKIRTLLVSIALGVSMLMATTGTLAYLTDTDSDVNVMTLGNVEIEQLEYQRETIANNETKLVEFEDAKPLYPAYLPNGYQYGYTMNFEALGAPGAMNIFDDSMKGVQDKFVFVKNTGSSDAYVRTWIAFEQGDLDVNVDNIHINYDDLRWTFEPLENQPCKIGDNKYYVVSMLYKGGDKTSYMLPAKSMSAVSLAQVCMTPTMTSEQVKQMDGNGDGLFNIRVFTQAVQTENFKDVEGKTEEEKARLALEAAFGNDHPWTGDAAEDPTFVTDADNLRKALEEGGDILLLADVTSDETFVVPEGVEATLDLGGNTITGTMHKNDGSVLKNEGTLTLKGGTVKSTANNGGSAVVNNGTMTVNGTEFVGAPNEGDGWPSYAVNNYGAIELNDVKITSNHGALSGAAGTTAVLNNADFTLNGIGGSSHVFYLTGDAKLTVNSGEFTHNGNVDGSLISMGGTADVTVNGGSFSASNGGYGPAGGNGTTLTVNGGTFKNAFLAWGAKYVVNAGTFHFDPTSYVAAGSTVTNNGNGTWTVAAE